MEEEICYSAVVIKKGKPCSEEKEETIYSEVKRGKTEVVLTEPIGVEMKKQQADLRTLTAVNQQLMVEKRTLQNQTQELNRTRENLNRMLGVILTFDNFPVKDFCPNKKCQPCPTGWVQFETKCFLFYDENPPWKSWDQSRKFCQNKAADLVVVDNLQEQEFISNKARFYFDSYHGFWLGLEKVNNDWVWVDGRNDTLRFWMEENFDPMGLHVLLIPGRDPKENWTPSDPVFLNKFICERDVLISSS
ncbi:transcript variant X2 [Nothobranchius furzeri]|uniref:Transcript variant X2 n=1 Tax=Nothobranchius furzeri TaxID=105023 RepID=A0A9D3C379_NOTFU|nr:C-type lectin domain family 4 member G isoform X2 [Nothobranchius furzeri]KAF7227588.1 transcript variant X2 [Nothobranchius furzeri]